MGLMNIVETKNKLDSLLEEKYFYFLRFGDGDLTLIEGASSEQRHKNSPQLQQELTEALKIFNANYIVSSTAGAYNDSSGAYFWINDDRVKLQLDYRLRNIWSKFRSTSYHALIFQHTLEFDQAWLISFLKNLTKDKKVLFIAGDDLCGKELVHKALNINEEIAFSGLSNSYYILDSHMDSIIKAVKEHDIILPVLGMGTRVLAKRLWNMETNKTVVDLGVMIDALARASHRGWTKRMIEQGFVDKFEETL